MQNTHRLVWTFDHLKAVLMPSRNSHATVMSKPVSHITSNTSHIHNDVVSQRNDAERLTTHCKVWSCDKKPLCNNEKYTLAIPNLFPYNPSGFLTISGVLKSWSPYCFHLVNKHRRAYARKRTIKQASKHKKEGFVNVHAINKFLWETPNVNTSLFSNWKSNRTLLS